MARAGLNISQVELADKSGVSRPTIAEFEREARTPYAPNQAALVRVFEEAGVTFVEEDDENGEGLRLPKRTTKS